MIYIHSAYMLGHSQQPSPGETNHQYKASTDWSNGVDVTTRSVFRR